MIVTDPDDLREIVKGKPVEIRQRGEAPPVESVHAVQSRVGKKATCHVIVRETWTHIEGGYVAIVKRTERVIQTPPNFMGKAGGYTTRSDYAIGAFDGDGPEPEAPPKDWEDSGVELRARQQAILDRATRERLSFGAQIDALIAEARASRIDVRDRIRRLEREKELLERDLGRAA